MRPCIDIEGSYSAQPVSRGLLTFYFWARSAYLYCMSLGTVSRALCAHLLREILGIFGWNSGPDFVATSHEVYYSRSTMLRSAHRSLYNSSSLQMRSDCDARDCNGGKYRVVFRYLNARANNTARPSISSKSKLELLLQPSLPQSIQRLPSIALGLEDVLRESSRLPQPAPHNRVDARSPLQCGETRSRTSLNTKEAWQAIESFTSGQPAVNRTRCFCSYHTSSIFCRIADFDPGVGAL